MENQLATTTTTTEESGLLGTELEGLIIPFPLAVNDAGAMVLKDFRIKLQTFTAALNNPPQAASIDNTADGNARTVLISHIEMTLDEMFFGLWDETDFRWQVIGNEVVGCILLSVIHPVTGKEIKRTGAAAIQIMVDATPDELQYNAQDDKREQARKRREKNKWANNPENKKPAALDMGFPRLKAECLKNAAQSLGKLFGRDLNRKKSDDFKGLLRPTPTAANGTASKSESVVNSTLDLIKQKQQQQDNNRVAAR